MSQDKKKVKLSEDDAVNLVGKSTNKSQLSVRAYLEQTVVPVLLEGMSVLVKNRPEDEDPVVYLANWLLERQKNGGSAPKSSGSKDADAEEDSKANN